MFRIPMAVAYRFPSLCFPFVALVISLGLVAPLCFIWTVLVLLVSHCYQLYPSLQCGLSFLFASLCYILFLVLYLYIYDALKCQSCVSNRAYYLFTWLAWVKVTYYLSFLCDIFFHLSFCSTIN
ncbi:hypothetical protein BDV39DRAFT_164064 [Aspergillus sergii]|uniref:Uncharacterized protein n=1 Tax=Aspergillus sergii TaxID=1034303 RepID=A0A5N6WPV6_9EURO|nr:hypothetical protein BDV39DRAFT_164064 [Aspergillus sergii]